MRRRAGFRRWLQRLIGPRVVFALRTAPALGREGDRRLAIALSCAYGALAIIGSALALAFVGTNPLVHPHPWLKLPPLAAASLSVSCGVAIAFGIVMLTRVTVARYEWAQRLHVDLQPVARRFDEREIWWVAALSSIGEELFFRSFLVPVAGLAISTALFALLHQVRGPSRWVWTAWAGAVGLVLGVVFCLTGSLLGPIVAHMLVNATNLAFLKRHEI